MKIIDSNKHKKYLLSTLRKNERRIDRQKKVKRYRARKKSAYAKSEKQTVFLPKMLSLSEKSIRKIFLERIKQIKDYAHQSHVNRLVIDLSKIEELHPCGTLLFIAELDNLLLDPQIASKIHGKYPSNERVEQLFQHVKVLKKLKLDERIEKIADDNVLPWMHGSSCTSNGEDIAEALPQLLEKSPNIELSLCITTGIAEAIANAEEHAYAIQREDRPYKKTGEKWWFFVKVQEEHLSVVICDLGAGIPRTLPITWKDDFVAATRKLLKKANDGKCIEIALKLGRSRSLQGYRGKGLQDILRIVEKYQVGMLTIHSNRGIYSCAASGVRNEILKKHIDSTKESIQGTIIMWHIPISALSETAGAA